MKTQKEGWIRKEAEEITGIPAHTIQLYTDRGIISPEVAAPEGRGTTRRYSKLNLFQLLLIKKLQEYDFSLEKIKRLMPFIRKGREIARH